MNPTRVARLLRELAEEFDSAGEAPERVKPPAPKRAKRRQIRTRYVPAVAPSELDIARARQLARKAGIRLP